MEMTTEKGFATAVAILQSGQDCKPRWYRQHQAVVGPESWRKFVLSLISLSLNNAIYRGEPNRNTDVVLDGTTDSFSRRGRNIHAGNIGQEP